MLLRRRRLPLSSLASSRCRAWSDGQDRLPLAATSPLRAHLASRRAHARILHAPFPSYLPGLPHMTPPSLSPCDPTPQSRALCRPTSPNLCARYQDCVLCAPHLTAPSPSSPRPCCRPRRAQGTASHSPRTYHPPPTRLLLLLAHPPTSYLCPLRWHTHRPLLLFTRRLTQATSRRCLRARKPPATASAFARRPRPATMPTATEGEAVAEPAQQEGCAEQPRPPPQSRAGHGARWPCPLPGAQASTRGQGRQ